MNDAHHAEYLGAVAGFRESAGWHDTQNTTPAVGDFVSGITAGKHWSGHIEWFSDDDATVVVNVDHAWVRVPVKDITH
ncbi:MAG: hypothetical protein EBR82_28135 [Caulobacteraceae bacterium]|nr:hypothetical protein [Caulobacteraceae bacterium]